MIKTLQSVDQSNVVVLVLDAQAEISDQDAHIAGYVVEKGRALVVGVNKFDDGSAVPVIPAPDYAALGVRQAARLADAKKKRDGASVVARLGALKTAASGTEPLMPKIVDAVRARATLGEISDVLRGVWGVYRG